MDEADWIDAGAEGVLFGLADYAPAGGDVGRFFCVYKKGGFAPDVRDGLIRGGFSQSREDAALLGRSAVALDMSRVLDDVKPVFPAARLVRVPVRVAEPRLVEKAAPFVGRTAPSVVSANSSPVARPAPTPVPEPSPSVARPVLPVRAPLPGRGAFPRPVERVQPTAPVADAHRAGVTQVAVDVPARAVDAASPGRSVDPAVPDVKAAAAKPPRAPRAGSLKREAQRAVVFETAPLADGQINPFQMKYVPESKVGSPIAAIPINLSGPTGAALRRVTNRHGNVDDFVAKRLAWSVDEMGRYLSPEQVDAVALAFDSAERGQGFVLADATGLGKGRVLAAICRGMALQAEPIVFVTEKENLFSDLWRDIVDINSGDLVGRPFMLNGDARIVDGSSADVRVVHEPWDKKVVRDCVKKKKLPPGCLLAMASYSQFNKVGSPKAEFLKKVVKGRHLVCDESHNAVGDSATSQVLSEAMDGAMAVTYSSATFARHAANLAAYKRLFPASMRSSDLMEVLTTGGQAISEALSQMLAEDGAYLRREHDLSGLTIEVVDDMDRIERNRVFADALSPILAKVAKLSREVSSIVSAKNEPDSGDDGRPRKGGKEFWSAGNFGARLGLIVRQFTTALTVDLCVERSVEALLEGRKPVVVVESTMESLMRELASDKAEATDETISDEAAAETLVAEEEVALEQVAQVAMAHDAELDGPEEAPAPTSVPLPPTFKDALNLLVDRSMQISVRRGKADPEKVPVEDFQLVADAKAIKAMIEGFPELPLSPIDDVREGIERASRELVAQGRLDRPWIVEEISARSLSVVDGAYVQRVAPERVSTVARFQNGMSDGIILTRAASTGLSLHASEKVSDQRPRVMLELQIPSNVVERVQFWGRVKRRGQVCEPSFMSLTCGLELQMRQLAVQNRKVADLSANVTASAASATAMKVPDIIDPIGNAIAKRMLEEQPRLAEDMHIAMRLKDMETAEQELYHINKLLQRLVLLPSKEQGRVYREVVAAYDDALREMKAKGKSPRGARELAGEWAVVERETFEPGDSRDGKVFGRSVTLTTIETRRDRQPIGYEAVAEMIAKAEAKLRGAKGAVEGHPFAEQMKAIERIRPEVLNSAMSKRHEEFHINWQSALKDQRPNAVKVAAERLDRLSALIRHARPGNDITVTGEDGNETGVVVDVRPPFDVGGSHHPGRWTIRYLVPGDEAVREISAAAAIRDNSVAVMGTKQTASIQKRRFDAAPRGETPERRRLLDGNPVKAVIRARKAGWGAMATWRDAAGRLHRAVLVPKNVASDIDPSLTGRTTSLKVALAVLDAGGMLWTNPDRVEGGAQLQPDGDYLQVEVPADKKLFVQFDTERLRAAVGVWKGTGSVRGNVLEKDKVPALLKALASDGHAFNYEGRYRRVANRAAEGLPALEAVEAHEPAAMGM